jgi:hypothetical protein
LAGFGIHSIGHFSEKHCDSMPLWRHRKPQSQSLAGMNGGGPVGRMQTALAAAIKDSPEWEEF